MPDGRLAFTSPIRRRILTGAGWTIVFGVTMGFFEAAVVVYLNRLQALGDLRVQANPTSNIFILTEVLREAASLGMITSVACLSVRGLVPRVAQAAVIFGTWDITYYIFLKLLIGFPASLLTWDVLFLIPRPWIGPVLAPLIVSLFLIAGGFHALLRERRGMGLRPFLWQWGIALAGGLIVILSFVIDTPRLWDGVTFPGRFRWEIFATGLALAIGAHLISLRNHTARSRGERDSDAPLPFHAGLRRFRRQ